MYRRYALTDFMALERFARIQNCAPCIEEKSAV